MPTAENKTDTFKILLIEDNDADIKLLDILFAQKNKQCVWKVIKDGENAVNFLRTPVSALSFCPDLIILDLNIPRVDGQKIIQEAKTIDFFKVVPILVLTSSENEKDTYTSYLNGANCVLIKPSDLQTAKDLYSLIEQFWINTVRLPQRGELR